jgi:hypothetical protein
MLFARAALASGPQVRPCLYERIAKVKVGKPKKEARRERILIPSLLASSLK